MSATFSERLQLEHAAVAAGLPEAVASAERRRAAVARAALTGLPAIRDELWRYADLRAVARARLAPAAAPDEASALAAAAALLPAALPELPRFVFVNGRFAPRLSADPAVLSGGSLRTASSASAAPAPSPDPSPGPFPAALDAGADERFAWVNEAFATDVAQLAVHSELQLEVLFVSVPTPDGGASYPRLQIAVGPAARLCLVERHLGSGGPAALAAAAVQLQLGAGARCEHHRVQACASDALLVDCLLASLGADASYQLSLISLGAASARSCVRVRLAGPRANFAATGMSLADGVRVLDTVLQVEHADRATTSQQLLRAIANDRSAIGYASRVEVAAGAGGADSRQSLKGLIGSAGAQVNLRPQLEIHTDEVSASHGATTGSLDEDILFYLLSRGIDPQTARKLLEWAFVEDVMSRIGIPALRRQVELATVDSLGNAAALEWLL